MASSMGKKPCLKCDKGAAVTTCDGCQQGFCIKHILEHRQELAVQMDGIGQDYDLFRRDQLQQPSKHPLEDRINTWEEQSILHIRQTAEKARDDLHRFLNERLDQCRTLIEKNSSQMQSMHESDDFTEVDLTHWIDQLDKLRKLVEIKSNLEIINEDRMEDAIRMIKIRELRSQPEEPAEETGRIPQERFDDYIGKITLSEEGLVATCSGSYWDGSMVSGLGHYSTGQHHLRFRVERKGSNNLFFGIDTCEYEAAFQIQTSSRFYGWWELEESLESFTGYRVHTERVIRAGDELTLVLDCNQHQIRLEHHRTNVIKFVPVDLERCPFPWKILIILRSSGDRVRILPSL